MYTIPMPRVRCDAKPRAKVIVDFAKYASHEVDAFLAAGAPHFHYQGGGSRVFPCAGNVAKEE